MGHGEEGAAAHHRESLCEGERRGDRCGHADAGAAQKAGDGTERDDDERALRRGGAFLPGETMTTYTQEDDHGHEEKEQRGEVRRGRTGV